MKKTGRKATNILMSCGRKGEKMMNSNFSFERGKGLKFNNELVSAFEPRVVNSVRIVDEKGKERFLYTVEVFDTNGESQGEKTFSRLDKINWVQDFGVFDPYLKNPKILENKLLLESRNRRLESQKYVLQPGFHLVEEHPVVIIANHVIVPKDFPSNIVVESSSEAELKVGTDESAIKENVKKYIMFEPQISVLLFFGAMYGIIKPILMGMGVNCDMLIALVAPSGHLKTTLVRLYALLLDGIEEQEISFMDTVRSDCLISKIKNLAGSNLLIDDYHKNSSSYVNRKFDERLNVATRAISSSGDSAGVIITAETLKESRNILFSSHDRIFKIQMPLQNEKKLLDMKKRINSLPNNDFLGNVVLTFIQKLVDNYTEVEKEVREHMKKELPQWINQSTRTGNQFRILTLVERLFMKYFQGKDEQVDQLFSSSLEKSIKKQMDELCKRRDIEHETNAFELIYTLIEQGSQCKELSIKLVEKLYDESSDDNALMTEEMLIITGAAMQNYMIKKVHHPVSVKKIIDKLDEAGVLIKDLDKRTKKYKGRRHYFIKISVLKAICDSGTENI